MEKYTPIEVGERIKKQRQLLGLSRESLAEKSAITPRYVYDIELGLKGGSIDTLCRIADALHLPIDYLLFGENEVSPEYIPIIALIKTCPVNALPHLEQIISHYIQAVTVE